MQAREGALALDADALAEELTKLAGLRLRAVDSLEQVKQSAERLTRGTVRAQRERWVGAEHALAQLTVGVERIELDGSQPPASLPGHPPPLGSRPGVRS